MPSEFHLCSDGKWRSRVDEIAWLDDLLNTNAYEIMVYEKDHQHGTNTHFNLYKERCKMLAALLNLYE